MNARMTMGKKTKELSDAVLSIPVPENADPDKYCVDLHRDTLQADDSLELHITTSHPRHKHASLVLQIERKRVAKLEKKKADRPIAEKEECELIADFHMHVTDGNTVHIGHRWISQRHRNEGMFRSVLDALKNWLEDASKKMGKKIYLEFSCAQPELIDRLLREGFHPVDREDALRTKKILAGDPSLFVDYAKYNDDDDEPNEADGLLLCCFEGKREETPPEQKLFDTAYRVDLRYATKGLDHVKGQTKGIRDRVKKMM